MSTKIDWAQEVWNPVVGCSKVSLGCANCYAEKWAKRLAAMGQDVYKHVINEHGRWNGKVIRAGAEAMRRPLRWKEPKRIFVDSMSDLFLADGDTIAEVYRMMEQCSQHTFIVLTKRPKEMYEWYQTYNAERALPNVWVMVSIENQATAEARLPWLMMTPAAVRGVSCKPLLGPLNLKFWLWDTEGAKLDWVIAGCEKGPRQMDIEWARSLRDQAVEAGVNFFLKQMVVDGKLVKMPSLDGTIWDEIPCPCEETGCTSMRASEYLIRYDEDLIFNYCDEHARKHGFCLGCHEFFTEETWETGFCRECTEEFDEDNDPEAEYPYDWDEPVVPPDDDLGPRLPDQIVEQGPAEE
jgi:protein gp37